MSHTNPVRNAVRRSEDNVVTIEGHFWHPVAIQDGGIEHPSNLVTARDEEQTVSNNLNAAKKGTSDVRDPNPMLGTGSIRRRASATTRGRTVATLGYTSCHRHKREEGPRKGTQSGPGSPRDVASLRLLMLLMGSHTQPLS